RPGRVVPERQRTSRAAGAAATDDHERTGLRPAPRDQGRGGRLVEGVIRARREIEDLDRSACPDAIPDETATIGCQTAQLRAVLVGTTHARLLRAVAADTEDAEVDEAGLPSRGVGRVIKERAVVGPDRR